MIVEPAKSSLQAAGTSWTAARYKPDLIVSSAWLVVAATGLLTVLQRGWSPINHDVAWMLQGAGRMLDGAVFGRDIVDVNPPLSWWLGTLPAFFSRQTQLGAGMSFVLFVVATVAGSLALVHRLLALAGRPSSFIAVMLVGAAVVLLVGPGYDFGQREHLMTVLVLPYMVSAALRSTGTRISPQLEAAVGLVAAAGLCLKPHFLLIPMCLELLIGLRRRTVLAAVRPDTVAIALFATAYAAAVWFFAPDYLRTVVPDAVGTYWAYGNSLSDTATRAARALCLPAVMTCAIALVTGRIGAIQLSLLLSAAAALSAALVQMKGWPYHLYPAVALLTLAGGSMAAPGAPDRLAVARAALAGIVLAAGFPAAMREAASFGGDSARPGVVTQLASTFRRYAGPDGSVFAFITSPRNIHPAVLAAEVRWASAACCLHLLPAAIRAPDDAAGAAAAERQLAHIAADLQRERPAVIAIDAGRYKLGFGSEQFDYLAFLRARPEFAALLSAYVEQPRIGSYRIMVRSDLAQAAG